MVPKHLEWTRKPIRNIHITVREPDMKDFDVERFVNELVDMRCNFITLLTGGYHSIYRTRIPLNRENPYLGEEDKLGELVEKVHAANIKIGACVDVTAVPRVVYDHHPEWFVVDASGKPHIINTHPVPLYAACPSGGYVQDFIMPVVREHLELYDFDHFNLTGYGYSAYGAPTCHCHACVKSFSAAGGGQIPTAVNNKDPNWVKFMKWRAGALHAAYKASLEEIKRIKPTIATWINQGYHIAETSYAPIENLSEIEDFVKTEAQSKIVVESIDSVRYPPMWLAAEEGRYMNTLTDKKVITTTSYYFAWPWRKTAPPEVMEKMWIAEAAANNVNPFVHISGFPQCLDDRRGMKAVREMYQFLGKNERYYEDVESYVNVAVLLSQDSLNFYAGERLRQDFTEHYNGMYGALAESHIVFDIINERNLTKEKLAKYRVLVIPNAASMSDEAVGAIRAFVKGGGGLVSTYETSLYTETGEMRSDFGLADVFGCRVAGHRMGPLAGREGGERNVLMAYMQVNEPAHPVLAGLGDTDIVLNGGYVRLTRAVDGAAVPLTVQTPIKVFPEGEAWAPEGLTTTPGALAGTYGKGKSVFFPGMVDRMYGLFGHPDLRLLIANSVRWMLGGESLVELEAPVTVDLMVQQQKDARRLVVHLINLTGKRPYAEVIPVFDLGVKVKPLAGGRPKRVLLASTGEELAFSFDGGVASARVPRLDIYDLLVIES